MKNRIFFFFLSLLPFMGSSNAFASHIFGGELLYKNVTDPANPANKNIYVVTLTLYGDCSGSAFPMLNGATPQLVIYKGSSVFDTLFLHENLNESNVDVSPVCPSEINNTTCHSGPYTGVKRFVYSDTAILNGTSPNWQFVFTGTTGSSSSAGRSNSITNIQNVGASFVYLVATLNNTVSVNSSPVYSTVPTPLYCINVQQQYNQGAIDPDNDSLYFSLTAGLSAGSPVTYAYPYTATHPLSASAFSFDAQNGQMSFLPNAIQDALIVTKVSEFHNGTLIGTSMREMTFIVKDDCQNTPPVSRFVASSIVGAIVKNDNVLNVCTGTPEVSFDLQGNDANGDNIAVTINNVPINAIVSTTGDSTNAPTVHFDWNTANMPPGAYNLFLTLKDDHCPVTSTQTVAYTINIIDTNSIKVTQLLSTQCLHKAYVEFDLSGGTTPRTIVVTKDTIPFSLYNDYSGVVRDSFPAGNYTIYISSYAYGCSSLAQFSVIDNGDLPVADFTRFTYCMHDTANAEINLLPVAGAIATWYNSEGNQISAAPVPNTAIADSLTYYVTEQYKTCTSGMDTVNILVHALPLISFPDIPSSVCVGDKVYLSASGGLDYNWFPQDSIFKDAKGFYIQALTQQAYTVTATNIYNCIDSASITITDIQPCCQFSYPNAFTPNNDSKNDKFGIPVYGNLSSYELSIYDRWGSRVFHSYDVNGTGTVLMEVSHVIWVLTFIF